MREKEECNSETSWIILKCHRGPLGLWMFLRKWLSWHNLNVSVFKQFRHLAFELWDCKWKWGGAEGGEGDGGAVKRAWGLLGPTEGIVICNIHLNVAYQMQRAPCCSAMEISLLAHSALVTPRANSHKWIYPDNMYGELAIRRDVWVEKQWRDTEERGQRLQPPLAPDSLPSPLSLSFSLPLIIL